MPDGADHIVKLEQSDRFTNRALNVLRAASPGER
jgi:hypothetical protein